MKKNITNLSILNPNVVMPYPFKSREEFIRNMENGGLIFDREYNCLIRGGKGAFMCNYKLNTLKGLKEFKKVIKSGNEKGWVIVTGPAAPDYYGIIHDDETGLYCENYQFIIERIIHEAREELTRKFDK